MNLIHKLLVAAACMVALASCNKDHLTPADHLIYKMDGVLKTAKPDAYYFTDDGSLMIEGTNGSDDITLFIDSNLGVRGFQMGKLYTTTSGMYIDWHSNTFFYSDTGTVVINAYDGNHVSGTFHFSASTDGGLMKRNFTGGQFSAKISYTSLGDTTTWCQQDSTMDLSRRRLLIEHLSKRRNTQ